MSDLLFQIIFFLVEVVVILKTFQTHKKQTALNL